MSNKKQTNKLVLSAMFLALALILPFITGQTVQFGSMFLPMHYPIFLCGYFVGPIYGLIIGLIAPFLRFSLFGMPPFITTGFTMSFELATYGLLTGILYRKFNKTKTGTYLTLLISMLAGRIMSAITLYLISGYVNKAFVLKAFLTTNFVVAIPGIILQLIIIPILVNVLSKYTI